MGGIDALISRAGIGVVLKAPVMNHNALFCACSSVFLMAEDLPSQNVMLLYVAIGSTAPKYICLRQSWFILLVEFPSMCKALVALKALEAAIFACSWNLSWGSSQRPRYLMHFAGVTSFSVSGMFDGMCTDGLGFQFFILVKCISSFFTWSVFRPHLSSHLCVSLNAIVIILAVMSRVGPDAMIAPSSTYSVVGESIILSSLKRGLSSAEFSMHAEVMLCTILIMGEVKYAAKIGETHDPCGTPVSIGQSSSLLPSRQRVAFRSWRNKCTQRVIGSGIWYEQRVSSRCECGIVSKKPVISNVRMDAFRL